MIFPPATHKRGVVARRLLLKSLVEGQPRPDDVSRNDLHVKWRGVEHGMHQEPSNVEWQCVHILLAGKHEVLPHLTGRRLHCRPTDQAERCKLCERSRVTVGDRLFPRELPLDVPYLGARQDVLVDPLDDEVAQCLIRRGPPGPAVLHLGEIGLGDRVRRLLVHCIPQYRGGVAFAPIDSSPGVQDRVAEDDHLPWAP